MFSYFLLLDNYSSLSLYLLETAICMSVRSAAWAEIVIIAILQAMLILLTIRGKRVYWQGSLLLTVDEGFFLQSHNTPMEAQGGEDV
jgi:hypothetical protein